MDGNEKENEKLVLIDDKQIDKDISDVVRKISGEAAIFEESSDVDYDEIVNDAVEITDSELDLSPRKDRWNESDMIDNNRPAENKDSGQTNNEEMETQIGNVENDDIEMSQEKTNSLDNKSDHPIKVQIKSIGNNAKIIQRVKKKGTKKTKGISKVEEKRFSSEKIAIKERDKNLQSVKSPLPNYDKNQITRKVRVQMVNYSGNQLNEPKKKRLNCEPSKEIGQNKSNKKKQQVSKNEKPSKLTRVGEKNMKDLKASPPGRITRIAKGKSHVEMKHTEIEKDSDRLSKGNVDLTVDKEEAHLSENSEEPSKFTSIEQKLREIHCEPVCDESNDKNSNATEKTDSVTEEKEDGWQIDYIRIEEKDGILSRKRKSSKSSKKKRKRLKTEHDNVSVKEITERYPVNHSASPKNINIRKITTTKESNISKLNSVSMIELRNAFRSSGSRHGSYIKELILGQNPDALSGVTNHGGEGDACPGCGLAFLIPSAFFQHLHRKSSDIYLDCRQCNKQMMNMTNTCLLRIHLLAHLEVDKEAMFDLEDIEIRPLQEGPCLSLEKDQYLQLHRATVTDIDFENQRCLECLEIFPGEDGVKNHLMGASRTRDVLESESSCNNDFPANYKHLDNSNRSNLEGRENSSDRDQSNQTFEEPSQKIISNTDMPNASSQSNNSTDESIDKSDVSAETQNLVEQEKTPSNDKDSTSNNIVASNVSMYHDENRMNETEKVNRLESSQDVSTEDADRYEISESYVSTKLERSLKCEDCDAHLQSKCSLKSHKRIHRRKAPFICPECGVEFVTWSSFSTHVTRRCFHEARCLVFICSRCPEFHSVSVEEAAEHVASEHCSKYFKCGMCSTACTSQQLFNKHMTTKHEQAAQNCESFLYRSPVNSTKLFKDRRKLKEHLEEEYQFDAMFGYACNFCAAIQTSSDEFRNHVDTCQHDFDKTWLFSDLDTDVKYIQVLDDLKKHSESLSCKGCVKYGRNFQSHLNKYHVEKPAKSGVQKQNTTSEQHTSGEEKYKIIADKTVTRLLQTDEMRETRNMRKIKQNPSISPIKMKIKILSKENEKAEEKKNTVSQESKTETKSVNQSEAVQKPETQSTCKSDSQQSSGKKKNQMSKTKPSPSISTLGIASPSLQVLVSNNQLHSTNVFIQGSTVNQSQRKDKIGPCSVCGKHEFESKSQFHAHIQVHRTADPAIVQCKQCGACFASEQSWRRHLLLVHGIRVPDPDLYTEDFFFNLDLAFDGEYSDEQDEEDDENVDREGGQMEVDNDDHDDKKMSEENSDVDQHETEDTSIKKDRNDDAYEDECVADERDDKDYEHDVNDDICDEKEDSNKDKISDHDENNDKCDSNEEYETLPPQKINEEDHDKDAKRSNIHSKHIPTNETFTDDTSKERPSEEQDKLERKNERCEVEKVLEDLMLNFTDDSDTDELVSQHHFSQGQKKFIQANEAFRRQNSSKENVEDIEVEEKKDEDSDQVESSNQNQIKRNELQESILKIEKDIDLADRNETSDHEENDENCHSKETRGKLTENEIEDAKSIDQLREFSTEISGAVETTEFKGIHDSAVSNCDILNKSANIGNTNNEVWEHDNNKISDTFDLAASKPNDDINIPIDGQTKNKDGIITGEVDNPHERDDTCTESLDQNEESGRERKTFTVIEDVSTEDNDSGSKTKNVVNVSKIEVRTDDSKAVENVDDSITEDNINTSKTEDKVDEKAVENVDDEKAVENVDDSITEDKINTSKIEDKVDDDQDKDDVEGCKSDDDVDCSKTEVSALDSITEVNIENSDAKDKDDYNKTEEIIEDSKTEGSIDLSKTEDSIDDGKVLNNADGQTQVGIDRTIDDDVGDGKTEYEIDMGTDHDQGKTVDNVDDCKTVDDIETKADETDSDSEKCLVIDT